MLRRLFGRSAFLKKMNILMEVYAQSQNTSSTYKQLMELKPLIRTEGEEAWFQLNRASLLYDMKRYRETADVIVEIQPINPEFNAQCAIVKTKILEAL